MNLAAGFLYCMGDEYSLPRKHVDPIRKRMLRVEFDVLFSSNASPSTPQSHSIERRRLRRFSLPISRAQILSQQSLVPIRPWCAAESHGPKPGYLALVASVLWRRGDIGLRGSLLPYRAGSVQSKMGK